jgi:hypothetical protein
MTSPKAWEISGAVVKSPPRPKGEAGARIGPAARAMKRSSRWALANCRHGPSLRARSAGADRDIGSESSCPIVAPPKQKPEMRVGLAEELPMMRATPVAAQEARRRSPSRAGSPGVLRTANSSTTKEAAPSRKRL